MVLVKIEARSDSPREAEAVNARDVGDRFHGYAIVATVPGSPQFIIDVPEGQPIPIVMNDLIEKGLIVDWRYAKSDYAPLWLPDRYCPYAGEMPGDTFPLQGITESVRRAGKYGAGALLLICDTGLDVNHAAFRGKTVTGDLSDSHGHGTHTSSTAASAWGVASDAAIHMRNVLPGGNGSEAGVANGIRQAADYAVSQRVPAVMSLSLGGGASSVIDAAVEYAKQRGILVVVAAGNTANAPIGSPARAASLIVLACDRSRNLADFTSGTNWTNPNRIVATGVQIAAAAANTPDQILVISGTSMATPHVAGAALLLVAAGYTATEALRALATASSAYLLGHKQGPPQPGLLTLAEDFGNVEPPAPEPPADNIAVAREKFLSIIGSVEIAQGHRCAWDASYDEYRASMARIMDHDIGPIRDYAEQGLAALKVPMPEPPGATLAYSGTYSGHGMAKDVYRGLTQEQADWGPHHGEALAVRAPCPGRVEAYSMNTPLARMLMWGEESTLMSDLCVQSGAEDWQVYARNWKALTDGWVCAMEPAASMYIAVFWPDAGHGAPVKASWYGHCREDIRVGRVEKGDIICVPWDSGIRFEDRGIQARAAHVHTCGSATGQLSPNGDVDGDIVARWHGWKLTSFSAPGPNEYFTGQWIAGRPIRDWQNAGRPYPPIPS